MNDYIATISRENLVTAQEISEKDGKKVCLLLEAYWKSKTRCIK